MTCLRRENRVMIHSFTNNNMLIYKKNIFHSDLYLVGHCVVTLIFFANEYIIILYSAFR